MVPPRASSDDQVVLIDGHRITLTSLDKVLYPETGTTKGDVISYYAAVADVFLPHVRDRPATRKRWVNGVGTPEKPGMVFFQKNLDESTPDWVPRRTVHHRDHSNDYPIVNDLATLTWLAQIASLEIHVPQWQFGRTGVQRNPDRMVLDLDPGPGAGLAECAEVARSVKSILSGMGLDPLPVTSGSKGIHLYAALDGNQSSEAVSDVAHELARALEADHPDLVVSDMKKSHRDGKVLVDWSQNSANKTTVAPYSLRGRFRPTVAAPRTWRELASKNLDQLDYSEVLRRVARRGDLLAPLAQGIVHGLEPTPEHMARFESSPEARDRLARYRSMRDAAKTPEPVPAGPAVSSTDGRSFVIQEHHARRLHWDFRLEHDGVLVSWALPKGVPTEPRQNHLAVQTEDHPLEYGTFEGSIPAGEYGGGEVTIWDAGTYELEKWRDGKEVIATLHGEKRGIHRYALIHTGGANRAANNWLIHLMAPESAVESSASPSGSDTGSDSGSGSGSGSVSDTVSPDAPAEGARTARRTSAGGIRPRVKGIAPMLATLGSVTDIPDNDSYAFEMKWDGVRAIATVRDGGARFVTRNGIDVTETYPDLAEVVRAVAGNAVLDGEIVAMGKNGRPDFGLLQTRMKLTRKRDVDPAAASTPVHYMVFDILEADHDDSPDRSLLKLGYDDRRRILQQLVTSGGRIHVPPAFDGELDAAVASSRELGLEGVVAKERNSPYSAGKRSSAWIKIKHHQSQEVVIGGWRPGKGRRANSVGSLLMGIPTDTGLRYVGRVGTGFGDRELEELTKRFTSLERTTSPFEDVPRADAGDAVWVRPTLVGEVEFAGWTPTDKLRQPSWRGWRPDKNAAEVVRELP